MARTGAHPGDWKVQPMPAATATLAYARSFTAEEFARLRQGLVPEAMEDRWFIVWQDDALWFHRSWTGLCVYRLRFEARDGRFVVIEALANRDPAEYGGEDAHDLSMIDRLVSSLLELAARRA